MTSRSQPRSKKVEKTSTSWEVLTLGDVGEIISGGTPSTSVPEYWGDEINWISPSDLTGYKKKTIKKGAKSITKLGLKNSSARLMPEGSVLFSSRAPIGYVAIAAEELSTNQGFKSIVPHDFISSEYLYYFLSASKQKAEKVASGTTFKEISKSKFAELEIPVPDLSTQKAIVSKLEELFSELDKGIESLKLAQQQLKVYRQSVLKWAFEGRLTNENVKEGELPEGWKIVKLKSITESIQYGYTESSSKDAIGPKFLRITDIQENRVEWNDVPYCKITKDNKKKYLLKDGDLVFARTGATVGKSFLIKGEIPEAVFASYLIRVRVKTEINERFLSYFFLSPIYWNQITEGQVGIGQPNVNGSKLGQLDIVLAPLKDQSKIVEELENHLSIADKMEESIAQGLQQAEAMRQSILKRTFEHSL